MDMTTIRFASCVRILPVMLLVAAGGCEQAHDDDHHEIDEELCEHMTDGPSIEVAAVPAGDSGAPEVDMAHHRYDIDLTGAADTPVDVAFPSSQASEYRVALGSDVPFQVLDATGTVVAIEESLRSGFDCSDVAVIHLVDLGISTYRLRFGPTDETQVRVVLEAAGSHDHDW
jgi:hypothetical protein